MSILKKRLGDFERSRTWSNLSNLSDLDIIDNDKLMIDDWDKTDVSDISSHVNRITKKSNKKRKISKHNNVDLNYGVKGKWTPEEENEANNLISMFEKGILDDCNDGVTLRSYLARKLDCAPMRISKKFAGKCIGKLIYHQKTKNTDDVPPSRVEWTYKNNKVESLSDKTSDATYSSNEDRSHASSDDDKSINKSINPTIIPPSSSIIGYFYPFEEGNDNILPPRERSSSYLLSMIPKIPSMKQNFDDTRSSTPIFNEHIKEKQNEEDYYMDYLETENVGDIYYESIQKPSNNFKETDTPIFTSRPSSSTGKDREDWLETLNVFCSSSMENIAGLFRS